MGWVADLKAWTVHWAATDNAVAALFFLAFAESSFFPVPPDVLLLVMALNQPDRALFFALVTTAGSTLGGAAGYGIGLAGGRPLLARLASAEKVRRIHDYFDRYQAWAVGIAGFTPIPYKVFTISAGAFYIDFVKFLLVSFVSRGARFFLVGGLVALYGRSIAEFVERYFNLLSVIFVILFVGGLLAVRYWSGRAAAHGRE